MLTALAVGGAAYGVYAIKPARKFLGAVCIPGRIAMSLYAVYSHAKDIYQQSCCIYDAIANGDIRQGFRAGTELGMELADAVFMARSIWSVIKFAREKGVYKTVKDVYCQTMQGLHDAKAATDRVFRESKEWTKEWSQKYLKSKSHKYFSKYANNIGTSLEKFSRRVKDVRAMIGNKDEAHQLMA